MVRGHGGLLWWKECVGYPRTLDRESTTSTTGVGTSFYTCVISMYDMYRYDMYVCICVCMYVYVYTCMYVCVYVCMY